MGIVGAPTVKFGNGDIHLLSTRRMANGFLELEIAASNDDHPTKNLVFWLSADHVRWLTKALLGNHLEDM